MTRKRYQSVAGAVVALMMTVGGCDDVEPAGAPDLGAGGGADLAEPAGSVDLAMAPPADLSATASADLSAAADLSMGDDLAAPAGPTPFVVDDTFFASGYQGGGDVPGTISDDASCPARAGSSRGKCHHVTWTPGTNSWGGVAWQYPANNWGAMPGYAIPSGYGQVRFWAWGQTGGEQVAFLVGLGAAGPDQFQQRLDVTLTAQPKLYVLGVRGAYRDAVVSAFGWVTGAGATQHFYVDDITWVGEAAAGAPPSFAVDTKFGPSGYMGDGAAGFVTHGACASPSGGSHCHRYDWDPNADAGGATQGWAGVFWQSAPGNWGGATDPDGAAIADGYSEVRFLAWSPGGGGQTVTFLAGLGTGSHDGWQSKLEVHLTATPTLYSLGVGGGYGAHVVGGFGWVAGGSGLQVNIDGATWR